MVYLRTPNRTVVVGSGGGHIPENDNLNAQITSARVEALGLLAGMHFAKNWKGNVEWKIDNTSVISTQAKLSWLPVHEWMQQCNRGTFGNMACIQPQLTGTLDISLTRNRTLEIGKKIAMTVASPNGAIYMPSATS
jgi:hypothetical protein